jgi:hypothetical protein
MTVGVCILKKKTVLTKTKLMPLNRNLSWLHEEIGH